MDEEKPKFRIREGSRNLLVLGLASILVALATTGVSLAIYHGSGDIYLDRSRPGFLPDEKEIEDDNNDEEEYDFSKTGDLTSESLGEYLEKIGAEVEEIDEYEKPFDTKVLSDEKFGISTDDTDGSDDSSDD
ncbi:hypothetical protein IKF92_00170 [Candidatus Saccharibacteria bacterium]|nr:hypothetical protein [Candidatus Saccharibacteria bacterium]